MKIPACSRPGSKGGVSHELLCSPVYTQSKLMVAVQNDFLFHVLIWQLKCNHSVAVTLANPLVALNLANHKISFLWQQWYNKRERTWWYLLLQYYQLVHSDKPVKLLMWNIVRSQGTEGGLHFLWQKPMKRMNRLFFVPIFGSDGILSIILIPFIISSGSNVNRWIRKAHIIIVVTVSPRRRRRHSAVERVGKSLIFPPFPQHLTLLFHLIWQSCI